MSAHPHYAHTGLPLTDAVFRARADARSAQLKQEATAKRFAQYATTQSVFTFQRQAIPNISLCQDNDILTYDPQPDITPFELAHIQVLLTCAAAPNAWFDYKSYIMHHDLTRHFQIK